MFLLTLLLVLAVTSSKSIERIERVETKTWHLAMNLNPADGHVMGYAVGWAQDVFIGTYTEALTKDYLNRVIWNHPVSYIAIVRHQEGEVDAVKVFRFTQSGRSLLPVPGYEPGQGCGYGGWSSPRERKQKRSEHGRRPDIFCGRRPGFQLGV